MGGRGWQWCGWWGVAVVWVVGVAVVWVGIKADCCGRGVELRTRPLTMTASGKAEDNPVGVEVTQSDRGW